MQNGIAPRRASAWRSRLRVGAGLALGVGMLGWFVAGLHWQELVEVLRRVSWLWIGWAVIVMLLHYVIHAWRWGVLVRDVDPGIPFRLLWSATAVGWGFNTLLPLRAGNFLRPAVVARERGVSYTTLLFTTVAEYVCDAVGIIGLLLWMLWVLPEGAGGGILADVQGWGSWIAVGSLLAIALIVLLSSRQARGVVVRMVRPLPSRRMRERILAQFDQLVAGMAAVGNPLRLLEATAITMLYWITWLIAMLATFRAFDVELPLAGALFVEAALSLAMMVPQAPGFLGLFQVVTEEAMTLWGAPASKAAGIALVFWFVVFVPITLIGLFEGWRHGLNMSSGGQGALREMAEEAREARAEPPASTP